MWKTRWTSIVTQIQIVLTIEDHQAVLRRLTNAEKPTVLAFVNAHAMNSCATDPAFSDALASADILLRDGSGMSMLYRQIGRDPGRNMNGTDFIPELLTAFRGKRVAFWGTQDPFLAQAALVAEREFGVRVVSLANGFMAHNNYLVLAKETYPDLIVLGMGMPKQEQLARLLREKGGGAPLIACGGAVLDFLGGKVKRAPHILRVLGIEWLYRFLREPRRLFMRYMVGNPVFMLRVRAWKRQVTS